MSQRHLVTGEPQPPVQKGTLRLYGNRCCPFVQRAVLVLDIKKIPYETVNVNLETKPEWIFQKSPVGKVPVIEFDDGRILDESLIIADYLNEAYPQVPLYPKDPFAKAKEKLTAERFANAVVPKLFPLLLHNETINEESVEQLRLALDPTEKELAARNTPFFGGSAPNMTDLMIWPMMERLGSLKIASPDLCKIPPERFPKLLEWWKNMKSQEAVQQSFISPELHFKFLQTKQAGKADYDMLLKN